MEIIKPRKTYDRLYYTVGAVVVILNYLKHKIFGYRKPRNFSINEVDKAVDYDFRVVEKWLRYIDNTNGETLKNKVVLELGPGPDLGIGLILLMFGAKKYIAIDVCPLAKTTPMFFYEKLLSTMRKKNPGCDVESLRREIERCYIGEESRITYIVDTNFDLSTIEEVDIVFSQAAFEYFCDVKKTIEELSRNVKSGGRLVSEIDLQTHTSFLRDKDPLNIYRYNDFFWNLFKTRHSLNRIRSIEYKEMLEKNGWCDVRIDPLTVLDERYLKRIWPALARRFQDFSPSEMKMLSIMLSARKK